MSFYMVQPDLLRLGQERTTLDPRAYPSLDIARMGTRPISGLGAAIGPATKVGPSSTSPATAGTKADKTWAPATPTPTSVLPSLVTSVTDIASAVAPTALDIYRQRQEATLQRRALRAGMPLPDGRELMEVRSGPSPLIWVALGLGAVALFVLTRKS